MPDKNGGPDAPGGRPVHYTDAEEEPRGDLLTAVDTGSLAPLLAGETEVRVAPETVLRAFETYQENQRA